MQEFKSKNIAFTMVKLHSECDRMISEMQQHYPSMQVTDMEHASKTKSADEVNKMFIDSASFILRNTLGGKKVKRDQDPLWDSK